MWLILTFAELSSVFVPEAARSDAEAHSPSPLVLMSSDSVVRLYHARTGGIMNGVREVIRDSAGWSKWWSRLGASSPAPPAVDFKSQMLVLVAMGSRASTGYDIIVDSVRIRDSRLLIFVRSTEPAGDCAVGAMATQPVDVVRVTRSPLTPRFVESTHSVHCSAGSP